ncbi:zinc ABC transporter substrate-binding protein [Pontibacter sp. Tf4]|uniref:metal ABC transporter solute-binding protein, Zn/Mn family n=1 Tax=Pontibacter sp. Tf4 TaxID=2761620 RepID=UPI001627500A|nr:zinc ABC transporter substrate-binding protein [Pontibacter sp. Tf4]MBB6610088.1 zinc ABC transporter substrate-binding protein [Pontibacter sp. Tf4]
MKAFYRSLLPLLLLCLLCFGCAQTIDKGPVPEGKKMYVVTTTGILADAVRNIVGDAATVDAIMGSGVDPHLYKATQGDLQKLTDADAIVYNGLHLEGKMGEVLGKLDRFKTVITASAGIPEQQLLRSQAFADSHDPHIWFSVPLWQLVVQHLTTELQQKDPQNADLYARNAKAYLQQLNELHNYTKQAIATIPASQRTLITAHDAFGYFGRTYDIDVRGLQGISTVSEFGLQDVSGLVNFIVSHKIKAVFVESSVSPKAIEAVVIGSRQKGHTIRIGGTLYSDALGEAGTPEGTYIGMVRHNVDQIVSALK